MQRSPTPSTGPAGRPLSEWGLDDARVLAGYASAVDLEGRRWRWEARTIEELSDGDMVRVDGAGVLVRSARLDFKTARCRVHTSDGATREWSASHLLMRWETADAPKSASQRA